MQVVPALAHVLEGGLDGGLQRNAPRVLQRIKTGGSGAEAWDTSTEPSKPLA